MAEVDEMFDDDFAGELVIKCTTLAVRLLSPGDVIRGFIDYHLILAIDLRFSMLTCNDCAGGIVVYSDGEDFELQKVRICPKEIWEYLGYESYSQLLES